MSGASEPTNRQNVEYTLKKELLVGLFKSQQRVEGILSLCILDDKLDCLLRTVMIDDKKVDSMMDDDRDLLFFSMKVRLAFALASSLRPS